MTMSVTFQTQNPQQLLDAFDAAILKREPTGKIVTWVKHGDMIHYTHTAPQWRYKAYFTATITAAELKFCIIRNKDVAVSTIAYSFYHGHLIQTFLDHFDQLFSVASASAMPTSGDRCN